MMTTSTRPPWSTLLQQRRLLAPLNDGVLRDAHAVERHRGEVEPVDPVAGHIPGARSAPALANLLSDGDLLPPRELQARFAALGVRDDVPVGAYCGSGVLASHEILALELPASTPPCIQAPGRVDHRPLPQGATGQE